ARPKRVLVTTQLSQETIERIRSALEPRCEVLYAPKHPGWSYSELAPQLVDVDAVIAGGDAYDDRSLKSATRLRIIARLGAGYDLIDVAAASRRGIFVTTTPGANADAVADLTIGLIIALVRSIPSNDRRMKLGLSSPRPCRDLSE